MSSTLQEYLLDTIQDVLKKYDGAWLVWCDPQSDWLPLLQRVNQAAEKKSFILRTIDEWTADKFRSLQARKHLQVGRFPGRRSITRKKRSRLRILIQMKHKMGALCWS